MTAKNDSSHKPRFVVVEPNGTVSEVPTSNAHKVFVTAERGMVALEMVSDCLPVRRMHLDLTPLEARGVATWLNEMADEAGGTSYTTKSCSFCGAPCAEPLDRVCRACAEARA